jgi:hypothetical protein
MTGTVCARADNPQIRLIPIPKNKAMDLLNREEKTLMHIFSWGYVAWSTIQLAFTGSPGAVQAGGGKWAEFRPQGLMMSLRFIRLDF